VIPGEVDFLFICDNRRDVDDVVPPLLGYDGDGMRGGMGKLRLEE
jgi:hypothetical protein